MDISSVLLISKPCEERRMYATVRKLWPKVEIVSASTSMTLGTLTWCSTCLSGALQRLLLYPQKGFLISQSVPEDVLSSYGLLRNAGFTSRLVPDGAGTPRQPRF